MFQRGRRTRSLPRVKMAALCGWGRGTRVTILGINDVTVTGMKTRDLQLFPWSDGGSVVITNDNREAQTENLCYSVKSVLSLRLCVYI